MNWIPAMRRFPVAAALLAVTGMYLLAAPAPAVPGVPGDRARDTVPRYERESWSYPVLTGRNPFRPPSADAGAGPSLESLRLSGILYSPAVGSIAILADPDTGRRYRLREGDVVGAARLVALRPGSATFRVSEFGLVRRVTLQVKRESEQEPRP